MIGHLNSLEKTYWAEINLLCITRNMHRKITAIWLDESLYKSQTV